MSIPIYQVDSFTGKPFKGNPAGVCVLEEPGETQWMQNMAKEMNLSETAFLYKLKDSYNLRWFTPKVEVEMCGHATLASAHILWSEKYESENSELRFHSLSGILKAKMLDGWIELDFPQRPQEQVEAPPGLLEALGVKAIYVGKNKFDFFVEVSSANEVRALSPDFRMLREFNVRGVIVTAKSDLPEYDFVSRFFAPGAGIDEDPVTGSAHCCLAPYWSQKIGKKEMVAYQASERGGVVKVRLTGDRVYLMGKSVTIFKGELTI
ncbi:PhzF family phenazine biosynthesis protein [bacterium]|nr:PhzF family phenazine biosynthesis protein [bacterium]